MVFIFLLLFQWKKTQVLIWVSRVIAGTQQVCLPAGKNPGFMGVYHNGLGWGGWSRI
jgi:hypothetical protein